MSATCISDAVFNDKFLQVNLDKILRGNLVSSLSKICMLRFAVAAGGNRIVGDEPFSHLLSHI